jgi:hypothetical protein
MTKHDIGHLASISHLEPARYLRVLVPGSEVDTAIVARKIWELANALESRVQFIGLCKEASYEPAFRRQLATLSAMVGNHRIPVESKIASGSNWLNAVKSEWRTGDVVACFAEQDSGFAHIPVNQILESNLNTTVYVLSGLYQEEKWLCSSWVSNAMAWAGSIGLILGFFWLQLKLTQMPWDWAHTSLLYISIFLEAGIIWFWNSLFG